MKEFLATKVEEGLIELKSSNELSELYEMLDKDENFILKWREGDILNSKLIITTNISSKVKNGEIELKSKEERK